MRNKHPIFVLILLSAFAAAPGLGIAAADEFSKTVALYKTFSEAKPYFDTAYGYAVFPTVGKAGVGIGGAYGDGRVYRQGGLTGTTSVSQVSVGFQLGAQTFSQMIFFENEQAYKDFTSGSFSFSADTSVAAITAGAQATAGTTGSSASASAGPKTGKQLASTYVEGMAVLVHVRGGLMYEAAIAGQKFSFKPLKK